MLRIVIVEDDPLICKELKMLLENALYEVRIIQDFGKAAEGVLAAEPDLVLLDLNLPGKSGFDICSEIRASSEVPVIFVTGRTDSMDELNGILRGGDDYIMKPFNPPVLLARIAAVLKRVKKEPGEGEAVRLCHRKAELNLARGCVCFQGQEADLSKNELKILHLLFQRKGEIVPRADMMEYLWNNQVFVDDNALSVNVTRIRQKLAGIGLFDFIETKRGMGYRI